ncbi:MAG: beta strand repeat-containing protein, partial [Pirellulales bacterium]
TGLTVALDAAGGGSLSVSDIGGGKTAADLGITGLLLGSTGPLVGAPLNPTIDLTTPLTDILGTKASTTIASAGANNNVIVQASTNGPQDNGTNVVYVNDAWYQAAPGLTAGNEVATYNQAATPAVASLKLTGPNNDLVLTATTPGTAYNNVAVNIVDGGALGDSASASYDAVAKTLTLSVDGSGQTSTDALISAINSSGVFTAARDASAEPNTSGGFVSPTDIHNDIGNTYLTATDPNTLAVHIQSGVSTANDVIQAINKTGDFSASLDVSEFGNDGSGFVTDSLTDPASAGTLSGGSGAAFDQTGIQIVNGGKTYTVSFSGAKTIEDVLNDINTAGADVLAQINSSGTGINVQSRLSGSDFSIGENGGQTATQLGIRTFNANTALSDLNYGQGVQHVASTAATATVAGSGANNDLLFQATDSGTQLNGVAVQFDNTGAAPGTESVSYDSAAKTLTFDVGPTTNANTIIHVLANDPVAGKLFTASLAPT